MDLKFLSLTDFSISPDEEDLDVTHKSPQASPSAFDDVDVNIMMHFRAFITYLSQIYLPLLK